MVWTVWPETLIVHWPMTSPLQEIDVRWFLLLFAGAWLAISCFLSFVGGWQALAKRYRATSRTSSGKLFPFASMGVGYGLLPSSYSNCLFVRVDSAGIALSILPLFRFFHPKLFIPWSAVSDCRHERFWFMDCVAVYISEPRIRMMFRGRLGKEIYEIRSHA
jgi:hypothetical protein